MSSAEETLQSSLLEGQDNGSGWFDLEGQDNGSGWYTFEEILQEEQTLIKELASQREIDGQPTMPFSLAFSGGGIRCASFQCGVLWQLAKMNRLKDVDYLAAVSGGSYITTAFASEITSRAPPTLGNVQKWYLDVVARTIVRMQRNGGDFVRDCVHSPGIPEDGSGKLPKACDTVVLLLMIFLSVVVNPIYFAILIAVPVVVATELFYGAGMRAVFCASGEIDAKEVLGILWAWTPLSNTVSALFVSLALTIGCFFITKALPQCQLPPGEVSKDGSLRLKRPKAPTGYLVAHSLNAFFIRLTWFLFIMIVFIVGAECIQILEYSEFVSKENVRLRRFYCNAYIKSQGKDYGSGQQTCTDEYNRTQWFSQPLFASMDIATEPEASLPKATKVNLANVLINCILVAVLISIISMPIVGKTALTNTLCLGGPLVLFSFVIMLVGVVIFGPVTANALGNHRYNGVTMDRNINLSMLAAVVLLPFFAEFRRVLHVYYKKRLQFNFFSCGQDVHFVELQKSPYCPFVVLTGTSSDYQPPGDQDTISELSFTCTHWGSEETGYVNTCGSETLSRCSALSGAGCLDALTLSMNQGLAMRFWLEFINLSWGDFVLMTPKSKKLSHHYTAWAGSMEGTLRGFLYRLPCGVLWIAMFILFNVGVWRIEAGACSDARAVFTVAGVILFFVIIAAFFSWVPALEAIVVSPLLRQLHQATGFHYCGDKPPRMLYVTDGGVRDCTAVCQLLRRRCKRILLVLAATDPGDGLMQLKAMMQEALELKLASFYDPDEPRNDVSILLEKFANDNLTSPYLRIGVWYGWERDDLRESATLIVVKNRLVKSAPTEIKPYLTEEEICGVPHHLDMAFEEEKWKGLLTTDLGPFGCCDCCHTNGIIGNCGPKFPHGGFTGLMYLTPMWVNSLARLGFHNSKEAIEALDGI